MFSSLLCGNWHVLNQERRVVPHPFRRDFEVAQPSLPKKSQPFWCGPFIWGGDSFHPEFSSAAINLPFFSLKVASGGRARLRIECPVRTLPSWSRIPVMVPFSFFGSIVYLNSPPVSVRKTFSRTVDNHFFVTRTYLLSFS